MVKTCPHPCQHSREFALMTASVDSCGEGVASGRGPTEGFSAAAAAEADVPVPAEVATPPVGIPAEDAPTTASRHQTQPTKYTHLHAQHKYSAKPNNHPKRWLEAIYKNIIETEQPQHKQKTQPVNHPQNGWRQDVQKRKR